MGFEDQDVGDQGCCSWEEAIVSFWCVEGLFLFLGVGVYVVRMSMSEGMEFWCFQVQGMSNTKPAQLKHNEKYQLASKINKNKQVQRLVNDVLK